MNAAQQRWKTHKISFWTFIVTQRLQSAIDDRHHLHIYTDFAIQLINNIYFVHLFGICWLQYKKRHRQWIMYEFKSANADMHAQSIRSILNIKIVFWAFGFVVECWFVSWFELAKFECCSVVMLNVVYGMSAQNQKRKMSILMEIKWREKQNV